MPRTHQTQHRVQKDEQSRSQENAELKRQNRMLRRQVSRLQKDTEKLRAIPEPEPVVDLSGPYVPPEPTGGCVKCGSTKFKDVKLPIGTIRACLDCGDRKKL